MQDKQCTYHQIHSTKKDIPHNKVYLNNKSTESIKILKDEKEKVQVTYNGGSMRILTNHLIDTFKARKVEKYIFPSTIEYSS